MARHNLYMFRCDKKLTRREMASRTGVSRTTYSNIENGKRDGSQEFWRNLQYEFSIEDSEMWGLQKLSNGV